MNNLTLEYFIELLKANVNNEKLSDRQFRIMVGITIKALESEEIK